MQNNLAPIALSTYSRLSQLRQTVDALQKNHLAVESELFVFSDAPRRGDEAKVQAVRDYLRTIEGFREVHIVERSENSRVSNNRGGMRMLLEQYGRIIFLEEDILTAPEFLQFMNQALEKYESNKNIFSITGYCPPIRIPENYAHDLFILRRFNAWGFGIWKDRFDSVVPVTPAEYKNFAAMKDRVRSFVEGGGEDMMDLLRANAYGEIDAFDVMAMYAQFLRDQYTVYPTRSLTANIGMDGTGIHCGSTRRFDVELSDKSSLIMPDDLITEPRIVSENMKFRTRSNYARRLAGKMRRTIKRLMA